MPPFVTGTCKECNRSYRVMSQHEQRDICPKCREKSIKSDKRARFENKMPKKPMHYLMRGNLLTREQEIIKGPSETPFTEEADELNKKHYEEKYIEKFGKTPTAGHYTPNKKYIWFNNQVK